jgi:SAM-dependent methyltransferase
MLDYDKEAEAYDASRGGEPRAAAAADAVLGLVPDDVRALLDVACGTGIVTRRLAAARPTLRVTGADAAQGMARMAAARLPGAVIRADSRRLPFPDASFDAVTSVWLLHLVDGAEDVRAIVAECARVLRPGGVYVTTVDKAAAHDVGSDIDAVLASRPRRPAQDRPEDVEAYAVEHGLAPAGRARFRGHGQGRSPRSTVADLRRGWFTRIAPDDPLVERFVTLLEALPDQEVPRPDPQFALRAFRKIPAARTP